jgi:hypothetical protein
MEAVSVDGSELFFPLVEANLTFVFLAVKAEFHFHGAFSR